MYFWTNTTLIYFIKVQFTFTLVRPHIEYDNIVWYAKKSNTFYTRNQWNWLSRKIREVLNLPTLVYRRFCVSIIGAYEILHNKMMLTVPIHSLKLKSQINVNINFQVKHNYQEQFMEQFTRECCWSTNHWYN